MDLTPVTNTISSAFSAIKSAAGTAASGVKDAGLWLGRQVVWLGKGALHGIQVGAQAAGSFIKASWQVVSKNVQLAWQASYPYLASAASFAKANLIKLGGFLSTGPGVALLSSVTAVLLTNWALQDISSANRAKAVAILAFALISAATAGVLVAQAGFLPVLI